MDHVQDQAATPAVGAIDFVVPFRKKKLVHVSKRIEIEGRLYRLEYAEPGSGVESKAGSIICKELDGEGEFRFVPEAAISCLPSGHPAFSRKSPGPPSVRLPR